jgi:hypothetical protein
MQFASRFTSVSWFFPLRYSATAAAPSSPSKLLPRCRAVMCGFRRQSSHASLAPDAVRLLSARSRERSAGGGLGWTPAIMRRSPYLFSSSSKRSLSKPLNLARRTSTWSTFVGFTTS